MFSKIKHYVISILIPLAVGGLSAFITRNSMNIYDEIKTPPLAPPAIVFPIAWAVLYILMGISAAMVYRSDAAKREKAAALATYASSLIVNFSWSIIFFNFQAFFISLLWLVLLLVLVIRTIVEYKKIKPLAAWLQIPYALWLVFATYLNLGILVLN